jgi:hypothetical protein
MESTTYTYPVKTHKLNIGIEENPKFAKTEYYWDEEIVENISDLL